MMDDSDDYAKSVGILPIPTKKATNKQKHSPISLHHNTQLRFQIKPIPHPGVLHLQPSLPSNPS